MIRATNADTRGAAACTGGVHLENVGETALAARHRQ
jgi:hypothetical protein